VTAPSTSALRTEIIADRDRWNSFVESCPTGNITQTFEWGELSGTLGAETLRIGALQGDELVGALLLVAERAPLLRRPYLYAPRGPVLADSASPALGALVDRARQEGRRRGAFMLKVEPNVVDGNARWLAALRQHGFRINPYATHPRRSWALDIRPDEETLLAGMKEKWRYNIRLAGRKGVRVRESLAPADVDTFYRLYRATAERDGIFIHGQQHYADFLRLFGERGAAMLFIAEYESTPIAALIAATCGPVATYMFGASSNLHRNRMPNHLLQWTAIRWAKAKGCTLYDFRAIAEVLDPGEDMYSLYTYKQGFGGYSVLTLQTHDLPYSRPFYWAYTRALAIKRARDRRRYARELAAREAHSREPAAQAAPSGARVASDEAQA
jgi:lipid II:glycine glycyltransferase (peptidoglycan interpeptide bridge formation enzyme)